MRLPQEDTERLWVVQAVRRIDRADEEDVGELESPEGNS
jgi:hypothetical protein